MAMTCRHTSLLVSSSLTSIAILLFFILSRPSHCLDRLQPQETSYRGLVVAEKTRLGSTPPSCHNKCNQCHPCMAVQVPTLPHHKRVDPTSEKHPLEYSSSPSSSSNRYSNYKPLGWKCRCDGNFYNP